MHKQMTERDGTLAVDHCRCECGKPGCVSRTQRYSSLTLVHGLASTYGDGCRCDPCKEAHATKTTAQKVRANRESLAGAKRNGLQWTSAELEIATRPDLTAREAAKLLGRTFQAVRNVRGKCRNDPKFIALLGAPRGT